MIANKPFSFAELSDGEPAGAGRSRRRSKAADPVYTAEQMAQAVEEARREAALQADAEARAAMAVAIEQRLCEAVETVRAELAKHSACVEAWKAETASVSHRLAVALAKAAIPRALEERPLADIADVFRAALERLTDEPAIETRFPPDLVESGQALLADLAAETGFAGRIAATADQALGPGDAEIRWRGGAVDRNVTRLQAEAAALVDEWLGGEGRAGPPAVEPSDAEGHPFDDVSPKAERATP